MILYNVTVKVDPAVQEDWLNWMKEVHIPEVMATGMFERYQIAQLLGQDESEGKTFSIQYACKSMGIMQQYATQHAPALQKSHSDRYKDRFVAFRSMMEVIDPV